MSVNPSAKEADVTVKCHSKDPDTLKKALISSHSSSVAAPAIAYSLLRVTQEILPFTLVLTGLLNNKTTSKLYQNSS